MLATLGAACSLLPEQRDQPRAEQMERAVLPMARAALNAGQVETARRLYRRLLQIDPGSVDARMGLGDAAVESREPATAAQWYLAALANARTPEARHAALLAHGRAALSAGQLEPARKSFARLTDPLAETSQSNVAWGYNGLGLTLLLAGDLRGATAAMEQAVLRAPDEPRFRGNLARALAMLTELESGAPGATRDDALASLEAQLLPAPEPSVRAADSPPVPGKPPSVALPDTERQEQASGPDAVPTAPAPVPRAGERPPAPSPDAPDDAPDGGDQPDATLRTALEDVAEPPEPGHEDAPPVAQASTPPATAARQSAAPDAVSTAATAAAERPPAPAPDAPDDARDGGDEPDATLRTALEDMAELPGPEHEDSPPVAAPSTPPATAARQSAAPNAVSAAAATLTERPPAPAPDAPDDARDGGDEPDATLRTALEDVAELPGPEHEDSPPVAAPSTPPATAARQSAAPANYSEPAAEPRQEDPQEATPQVDVPGTPAPEASVASADGKAAQASEETASRSASPAASRAPSASPTESGAHDPSVATPPRVLHEDGWRFVQAASYASRAPAEALVARLREVSEHPVWVREAQGADGRTWSRVRVGPVPSAAELATLTAALEELGFGPLVVPEEDFSSQPSRATPPMVIEEDGARFVQAGAYAARSAAEELATRLQALTGHGTHVSASASPDHEELYRVRIGPMATHEALVALADRLEVAGYGVMDITAPDDPNAPAAPGAPPPGSQTLPFVVREGDALFVQAGAYASRATAEEVAARLRALTDRPVEMSPTRGPGDASLFRVRVGPIPSHEALLELRDALTRGGYGAMDPPAPGAEPAVASGAAPGTLAPPPLLLHEGGERYLQAGAYSARPAAESLAARLRDLGAEPVRVTETVRNGKPIYRVRLGPVEPGQPMDAWLDAIDSARRPPR